MSNINLLAVAFTSLGLAAGFAQTPSSAVKAFTGARLINPGSAPVDGAVIVVRGGKVEAAGPARSVRIPKGAAVHDLSGKFVIPGLITAHAHISDVQGAGPRSYTAENTLRQLGVFARYGVTAVWSLGGEREPAFKIRDAQNTPALDHARLFLAGDVITAATPEQARAMVAKVAATRPDVIKVRVDDQLGTAVKMPPDVYGALIEEAHKRGLRVAVHIFALEDAKGVLRAGADFIAHSVRDREIDDEFIRLMKQRGAAYCPTLTRELSTFVYESTPAFFSDPFFLKEADAAVVARLREPGRQKEMRESKSARAYKAALPVANRNLKKAAAAGIPIAMGTDSGAFPERFEGYFEHVEMKMMAEAGLSPAQILRSATIDAARAMKVEGIGSIRRGAWADFVVLDRDPLADIANTSAISSVWIAGNPVRR